MTQPVIEAQADGKAVFDLAEKIATSLDGTSLEIAVAALLTVILTNMRDDLTDDQLIEGVRGTSGWICTFLSTLDPAAPRH